MKTRINDGQLSLDITHTEGSGRKPLHHGLYFESENMRTNKRSVVRIDNTKDLMCMARSVVLENVMLKRKIRIRGNRSGIITDNLISRCSQ